MHPWFASPAITGKSMNENIFMFAIEQNFHVYECIPALFVSCPRTSMHEFQNAGAVFAHQLVVLLDNIWSLEEKYQCKVGQ